MGEKLSIAEIQRIIEQEGQGTIELLQDGTVRRRSDEEIQQYQKTQEEMKICAAATPRRHLIEELLDPRVSKTEREHAAVRLIGELASRLEAARENIERLSNFVVELGGNPDMIAEVDRPPTDLMAWDEELERRAKEKPRGDGDG